VDRLIIRMLPGEVRARHGEEVAELLDGSTRPVRDRADVLLAALGLRLGAMTGRLLVVAVLGVVVLTFGLVHAVGHLRDGAIEILDHWWSTFILVGLASTLCAVVALVMARRRAKAWRRPT
jgi:ABC-type Fe3+ transport system permease subunit